MREQDTNPAGDGPVETQDEEPATPAETRAVLLERSGRGCTPVNKLFVQAAPGTTPRHGPLSTFVQNRDRRGLLALLLIIGMISSGERDGWSASHPLSVWARAFGTTKRANGSAATAAVSKILTRLQERDLIERKRHGRQRRVRVTLLREDGSGAAYTRPGKGNEDRFLQLPHAFWLDGWHEQLSLAAIAMLLVALHEKPNFRLAAERMPEWYGWSADTAERGFAELERNGLIAKTTRFVKAPLSPSGLAKVNEYVLTGPLVPPGYGEPPASKGGAKRSAKSGTAKKPLKKPARRLRKIAKRRSTPQTDSSSRKAAG